MSFEAIRRAVEGRMSRWGEHPVEYDGHPATPPVQAARQAKTPWVRVTIQPGDSIGIESGQNPMMRRTGLIMIQVFTKPDKGTAEAYRVIDSLIEHFEMWPNGHFETLEATPRRVGETPAGYFQMNLNIRYRYS